MDFLLGPRVFFSVIVNAGAGWWFVFIVACIGCIVFLKNSWWEPGNIKRVGVCALLAFVGLLSVLNEGRVNYAEELNDQLWNCTGSRNCAELEKTVDKKLTLLRAKKTVKTNPLEFFE